MQKQELGQCCIPVTPATPSSYGKLGILQHYRNSNNLSSVVRAPWDRHAPFQENPHPWTALKRKRGAAVPSCVPGKLLLNPRRFSQTMDRGTFQALTESILPSHPMERLPLAWQSGIQIPAPQKGTFAQCHRGEPTLLLPEFPIHLKLGNSWLHLSQQLITKSGQKLLQFLYLSYPGQFRNPIFSRKTLSKGL